jgi:hypothetical protein
MGGSIAEERIRAKAEAHLRLAFPEGRIIHELVTANFGPSRIDLACVTHDMIIGLEIKSERDVLDRLARQYKHALAVCDHYAVVTTPEVADKIEWLQRSTTDDYEPIPGMPGCMRGVANPDFVPEIRHLEIFRERGDGLDVGYHAWADPNHPYRSRWLEVALRNPADRLAMLWAAELRLIAAPLGAKSNWSGGRSIRAICEEMTGRQIRRAVCAALRQRAFPRADVAMEQAA